MKKRAKVKENAPTCWSIPPLSAEDNKYTRGHVLILGGEEMTGAARLAALAAQRAGAGLVTIATTRATWPVYAASMLSVITRACDAKQWNALLADARINPVLIGPGAGVNLRTKQAITAAAKAGKTLILDADALTVLATDATLRKNLLNPLPPGEGRGPRSGKGEGIAPSRSKPHHALTQPSPGGRGLILTPHEGEYARLAKALKLDMKADKPARAVALAKAMHAVVVLKGSETFIADADGKLLVTHAPAWLATGGTGDVLAGIIAALVGQGMGSFDAAAAGVWLHSETAMQFGPGMIAEDIIAGLPAMLPDF